MEDGVKIAEEKKDEKTTQGPVGDDAPPAARANFDLGDEQEIFALSIRFEQILERLAERAFVARAAVADELFDLGVVLLDELDGHDQAFNRSRFKRDLQRAKDCMPRAIECQTATRPTSEPRVSCAPALDGAPVCPLTNAN